MDSKLKKRLVVATIVVVLVVIFLPMFFGDQEETEPNAQPTVIPEAPQQSALEQKLQPTAPEPVTEQSQTDQQEQVVKLDKIDQITENTETNNIIQNALDTNIIIDQTPVKEEAKPVIEETLKEEAAVSKPEQPKKQNVASKVEKTSPPKASASRTLKRKSTTQIYSTVQLKKAQAYNRGWVIQLGSFNQTKNANALIKRLRDKGFQAFGYSKIKAGRTVNRVYIGPFSQLDKAKKMRDRLLAMNIDNFITRFEPVDID